MRYLSRTFAHTASVLVVLALGAGCGQTANRVEPVSFDEADQALAGAFCSAPAFNVTPTSGTGTAVILQANATCGTVPAEYRFFVKKPGASSYVPLDDYSTANGYGFYPGPQPGRYTMMVYVRPAGSTAAYDAMATASYLEGNVCSSATIATTVNGSTVDLAASASCSGPVVPEYRFLVKAPGATAYTQLRSYDSSPKASFSGGPSGRYEFLVYVRAAGNASDWEAGTTRSAFVGATCTSASLTPAYDGVWQVPLAANATCTFGASPEYRFMVRRPGQTTFTELRPYGGDPTFPYLVDPPTPGRYEFQVLVRATGNASDWEANPKAIVLVGATCASASLSVMFNDGTQAYLVGSASCTLGGMPEYRFLVRRPGQVTFTEARPYAPDPNFAFYTGGMGGGRFELQVQTRSWGNASEYEGVATKSAFFGPACPSATLSVTPNGGDLVLAADATCRPFGSPEYRFLVRRPGDAGFSPLTAYGPNPGLLFPADPLRSGRYDFQVQARAMGNASDYESSATRSAFVGPVCPSASLTATNDAGGAQVALAASASCTLGTSAEFRFMARRPGEATFTEVRPYAPDPRYGFVSSPPLAGRYEFQVQARAAGNASDSEALATATTFSGPACTSVSLGAAYDGAARVTLDANASCTFGGAQPEYRFLVRRTGETTFTEVRPYSPSRSTDFYANPPSSGRYEFQVQARAWGNASDYESLASATILIGASCGSASLTASWDGGAAVNLAANASCASGAPAEYRFMVRGPGEASFTEVHPYGPDRWFTFFRNPAAPGRYDFQVLVRAMGNTFDYDAIATATTFVGPACSTASLTPTYDGDRRVDLAASAGCAFGAPAEYRFMIRRPGETAFTEIRPYGPDPAFSFLAEPLVPGRYDFQVQARVAGNRSDYEALASATAFVGPSCSAATLTVTSDGTDLMALAAATTCTYGTPEYRFLVRPAGATTFTEIRPYFPEPVFLYFANLLQPGRYEFQVQVRLAGDPFDYEVSATATALVGRTCDAALLGATYDGGSMVDLEAAAACSPGTSPEYRFLIRRPGEATFTEIRPYDPAQGFPYYWNSPLSGRYEFQVSVRAQGNTSDYEAQAARSVLVGPACTAAAVTVLRDLAGGPVQLSASASCRSGWPEYRFMVRQPGATAYVELRSYSGGPQYLWEAAGLPAGRYDLLVYAREIGNFSPYEASATSWLMLDGH